MTKLTVIEGEERLKTEIDWLSKQLYDIMHENEELRKMLESRGAVFTLPPTTVFTFDEPNKDTEHEN